MCVQVFYLSVALTVEGGRGKKKKRKGKKRKLVNAYGGSL